MQAPGVSIRDIFDAAVKCKEIYEKFRDPHRNAPRTLAAFKDELDRVERSLRIQDKLELWTGEHYPGAEAFKAVLEECSTFLVGKQKILDYGDGRTSVSGAFTVAWSAFDNSINRLKKSLAYHQQEFLNFKMDLLLEHAINRADHPDAARPIQVLSAPDSDGLTEEEAKQLDEAVSDMVRILYKYKRLTKDVTIRRESPSSDHVSFSRNEDNEQLDASFCTTLAHICRLIDLPDQYRPPRTTLQNLPRDLSEVRQQAAIETSTGTIRYPPTTPMVFPRQVPVKISFTWQNRNTVLDAASYLIVGDKCVFHNAARQPIFEQRIFPRPRLDTYHQSLSQHLRSVDFAEQQGTKAFFSLRFVELQDIRVLRPDGGSGNGFKLIPDYVVFSSEDYEKFQTDLRSKRFLRDFFVKRIDSKNSGPLGNAQRVCVKLWEDNMSNAFISFPAMFDPNQKVRNIWEIPLKFFDTPKLHGTDTVRLQFAREQRPGGNRRNSSEKIETSAQLKWASSFEFLALKFESRTDPKEFLQSYEDARTKPKLPLISPSGSFESGLSRFTAPSIASSSLGSPMSFQSTPQDNGLRRTSTAATSPMSPAASIKDPKGLGKLSNMLPRAMIASSSALTSDVTVSQQQVPESASSGSSHSTPVARSMRDIGTDPEPSIDERRNGQDPKLEIDDVAATPMSYFSRLPHTDRVDLW